MQLATWEQIQQLLAAGYSDEDCIAYAGLVTSCTPDQAVYICNFLVKVCEREEITNYCSLFAALGK